MRDFITKNINKNSFTKAAHIAASALLIGVIGSSTSITLGLIKRTNSPFLRNSQAIILVSASLASALVLLPILQQKYQDVNNQSKNPTSEKKYRLPESFFTFFISILLGGFIRKKIYSFVADKMDMAWYIAFGPPMISTIIGGAMFYSSTKSKPHNSTPQNMQNSSSSVVTPTENPSLSETTTENPSPSVPPIGNPFSSETLTGNPSPSVPPTIISSSSTKSCDLN